MYTRLKKPEYDLDEFLKIMHKLRAPDGCQWDRQQTHQSIRRDFLEECYEAIEAIDNDDTALLREELGDVLLQVVFHSVIEEEKENFDFHDVVNDVAKKMVVRHPHVFGEVEVNSVDDILTNWDSIKKETKGQKSDKEMLESVSKAMPALMRNQKIQKKAKKLDVEPIKNPTKEIKTLLDEVTAKNVTEENIGKLLASVVKLAQDNGIDAEESLYNETEAFISDNF